MNDSIFGVHLTCKVEVKTDEKVTIPYFEARAVTHFISNFDMNFTVFYDARDLLNGNTIEYLLIWTSCMYNVHCTSRCMFL